MLTERCQISGPTREDLYSKEADLIRGHLRTCASFAWLTMTPWLSGVLQIGSCYPHEMSGKAKLIFQNMRGGCAIVDGGGTRRFGSIAVGQA